MKRKVRIISLLFVMIGTIFLFSMPVEAVNIVGGYNGGDIPYTTNKYTGTCEESYEHGYFCRTPALQGTRISFVYFDGKKYTLLGHSKDFFRYSEYRKFFRTDGNTLNILHRSSEKNSKVTTPDKMDISDGYFNYTSPYYYSYALTDLPTNGNEENYWTKKLITDSVNPDNSVKAGSELDALAKELTGHSLLDMSYWSQKTEAAVLEGNGDISKIGYRILIEPVRLYTGRNKNVYVMSYTEYASVIDQLSPKTTDPQFNYYFVKNGSVRLYTKYDDIGINKTLGCTNVKNCKKNDLQFHGAGGSKGEALQIIDISNQIGNTCDFTLLKEKYENGESYDEKDYECCDELRDEIDKEYKDVLNSGSINDTEWCMKISGSEDEFFRCLKSHIQDVKNQNTKFLEYSEKLYKFYQDYPGCGSGSSCEEAKEQRDKEYDQCKENLRSLAFNMATQIAGLANRCEQIRDLKTEQIKNKYPVGCIDDEDNNTENKKYICVYDKENDIYYGITGEELTGSNRKEQYKKECPDGENPEDPDKPISCDYNDRNVFPSTQCGTNTACCEEKERELREEAIKNNWTDNELYNEIYNWYNEPGMEFRKNCLCGNDPDPDPDEEEDCTWEDYEVSGISGIGKGNCTYQTNAEASDSKDWECIYKSDTIVSGSKTDEFKDYYLKMKNPYCGVYCRETVRYDFPNGNMIVKAGNHFTVNQKVSSVIENWAPIQFTSTRQCRTGKGSSSYSKTAGIDYDRFERDYKEAKQAVSNAWDRYQITSLRYNLTFTYRPAGRCGCCGESCHKCKTIYATGATDIYKEQTYGVEEFCTSMYTLAGQQRLYRLSKEEALVDYERAVENLKQIEYDIQACTNWNDFFDSEKYALDYPSIEEVNQIERDANEGKSYGEEDTNMIILQDRIDALIEMKNNLEKITPDKNDVTATRYRKYDTYRSFIRYDEFSPDIKIKYVEPTNSMYNYEDELYKKYIDAYESSNNFAVSEDDYNQRISKIYCGKSGEDLYLPDGRGGFVLAYRANTNWPGCVEVRGYNFEYFDHGDDKYIEAIYEKSINYVLKDHVFDVVIKPDGTATSSNGLSLAPNQIAIHLGYSALHTHFMTPTGRYDINLSYPAFTPKKGGNGYTHNFDQFLSGTQTYECSYQVHNEIIENKDPDCEGDNCEPIYNNDKDKPCGGDNCDPTTLKGLNLIYRPISLGDPFPGIEGEGRKFGSNWKGTSENETEVIEKYITNNRELEADKIYSEAYPMYQITLTPARIKEIRKYNDYEMKEDRGGYNDWNMDCSGANECKSDFIRKQVENGQDFSKYFREECTMSAGRNKKSECCGVGNWNDCAEEDQSRNGGVR